MRTFSHLVVGLGNPGAEYASTRHNIGFIAVDALARKFDCQAWKKKFKGLVAAASEENILLLKPQTYMNLSGESVAEAVRFYKMEPSQVIVFHDDLDLLPGQVRVKQGGGSGGHNGIKSIDAHIGTEYWRVRLGIGHPGVRGEAVTRHVLNKFTTADALWLEPLLDILAKEFDVMLANKTVEYANRIARRMAEHKELFL